MEKREKSKTLKEVLEEASEYKRLQSMQPNEYMLGGDDERIAIRRMWEVKRSDFGVESSNSGTVVFEVSPGRLWVETWENGKRVKAFHPEYDLEAYAQVCEERGWTVESF